ncbi:hypothetical protein Leryth_025694, partial [Lithospermum erythrorhizon]
FQVRLWDLTTGSLIHVTLGLRYFEKQEIKVRCPVCRVPGIMHLQIVFAKVN